MRHLFPFAKNLLEKNRQSPSTTKIAEAVGIARGTAYKYLVEMAEKRTISGIFENMKFGIGCSGKNTTIANKLDIKIQ